MEKIPEIVQIWNCQFLSPESQKSEIDEKSMKANNSSFFPSYTVYVDTGKFQTTNKTVFASQGFSGLGFIWRSYYET